jgi:hypothetical protein
MEAPEKLPDGVHRLSEESAATLERAHQRAREVEAKHLKPRS